MANANVRQITPGPVHGRMTDDTWIDLQQRVRILEEFLSQSTFGGEKGTPPSPLNKFITRADLP